MPVVLGYIGPYVQDVIHVPALRANPSRTYRVTGTGPGFPGRFERYAASMVRQWQKQKSRCYEDLNKDMTNVGLVQEVFAHRLSDAEIELLVNRAEGNPEMVSIADVGFGVSQALPVLVALRAADSGRLVYLEEPETDLHPRAQIKLADILADAAKRGVRVVAETHSSLLLTAIQTLVAKGELDPKLVKLHWFQRDPKTGITQVTPADLDENGAFGDWPEDFDAVGLNSAGGYLDAVEGRKVR